MPRILPGTQCGSVCHSREFKCSLKTWAAVGEFGQGSLIGEFYSQSLSEKVSMPGTWIDRPAGSPFPMMPLETLEQIHLREEGARRDKPNA